MWPCTINLCEGGPCKLGLLSELIAGHPVSVCQKVENCLVCEKPLHILVTRSVVRVHREKQFVFPVPLVSEVTCNSGKNTKGKTLLFPIPSEAEMLSISESAGNQDPSTLSVCVQGTQAASAFSCSKREKGKIPRNETKET